MWWTFAISPQLLPSLPSVSSQLLRLSFFWLVSFSLFLSSFWLPFYEPECFATARCSEAHSAGFVSCCFPFILWCSLCRCLRLFPQRRWMPFSGHADSGLHRRHDIKRRRVLFQLRGGWFHPSLFWLWFVLRPALLCTVYDCLPLVACSKISTNRWCWIIHPSE